ncbi:MAG TPA: four helix bundle protein [Daejeonella sp.]|uniref:four helix bundle protein n=1 Tax=Daejeonella sp. TaxID=2805397 RepID=UPI0026A41F59|nr:four helix bundle protein [Daejeonella sp.]HQS04926.1 four helix bundle protein [Daejeonella sp.]HQS51029.1 four helix bundle protein [Daejeonella sp.]HQT24693.1 four helix bundle protein [Daejeonella sp.]HQT58604.1 four helix bundle protein [Daejeonella sp.]
MSVVATKSYCFAIKVVAMYKFLVEDRKEYVLSKQLLRCGTAIGALVREAQHAQSRPDFVHKMSVALKEANETAYWISLLNDTGYLSVEIFSTLSNDCDELLRLLVKIVKTAKGIK